MGVVTGVKGSAFVDTSAGPVTMSPAEVNGRGHVAQFFSTLEAGAADSSTSTYWFGSVPSNARLTIGSRLDYDALTGVTSFSLGVGKGYGEGNGVLQSASCLINAADIHLAGSTTFAAAVDIANFGKPLWQIAGYADDPGGSLDIIGTSGANGSAGGTLSVSMGVCVP